MKKPEAEIKPGTESLPLKSLRALEQELGIYLDKPKTVSREYRQQFGVLDENEQHVGDIVADNLWFTEDELRTKIQALFKG